MVYHWQTETPLGLMLALPSEPLRSAPDLTSHSLSDALGWSRLRELFLYVTALDALISAFDL
jgi:hypothetical protein